MKTLFLYLSLFVFTHSHAQVSDFETIDFSRADYIAKLNGGKSLVNLPILANDLTSRLETDAEKFRAIYFWVCNNIQGDIKQNNIVNRKQRKHKNDSLGYLDWNNDYKKKAFKTLLKQKKTMCTGYAYLIKELCFLANIECEIINGYGRTAESNVKSLDQMNHSWNAVKLNDKWYLSDATWSSGYILNDELFIKDYNDGYFLADPLLFGNSHFPTDKKWFLNETLSQTEFAAPPLVYGETFERQIIPIGPKTMTVETTVNTDINFSFKTLKTIPNDKIQLIHYRGNNEQVFDISNLKNENGVVSFNYQFKYKGQYDVHLKIEEDVVATWTIYVVKGENMDVVLLLESDNVKSQTKCHSKHKLNSFINTLLHLN